MPIHVRLAFSDGIFDYPRLFASMRFTYGIIYDIMILLNNEII